MLRVSLQIVAVSMFVAWFFLLRPTVLGGPANYIMVSGTSMEPTFFSGDLVIIRKHSSYNPGDVVAYSTSGGNVIHRIVEQRDDGRFVLLGDNRDATDPMFPAENEVMGKQWVLIPNGGDALLFLRQPFSLAVLGGLAIMSFSKRKQLSRFLQRRSRSRNRRSPMSVGTLVPGDQSKAMTVFGTSVAITLVFFLASIYALRQPATSANADATPSFSHQVNFGYDIAVTPSTLYQNDTISSNDVTTSSGSSQPIYAKLTQEIDLDIEYHLRSQQAEDIAGHFSVVLEITAVEGWKKVIELQPKAPFKGTTARASASISIPEVQELISQIEEETGFKPASYSLSVIPEISVTGNVTDVPVDSKFTPSYTFELTATRLNPQSDLVQTQIQPLGTAPVESNHLDILGFGIGVQPLRVFGGLATIIGFLVTGVLAATVFLGLGRDEAAKVQARFKTIFIEASNMNAPQPVSIIDVASLQDLARLAQRDGGIVFHKHDAEAGKRYFVPDGTTMYQFTPRIASEGGQE